MLMFLNKMRKSKAGYTLTELIVVITVLGILAAVATPFVGDYIGKAKTGADNANAKVMEDIISRNIATFGTMAPADITSANISSIVKGELKAGIPTPQQSGMKFIMNKATFKVTAQSSIDAAKEIEIKEQ